MVKFFLLVLSVIVASAFGADHDDKLEAKGRDSYIIGGANATLGQFPYMVSLRRNGGTDHFCGGSILNANTVLTAAHCCVPFKNTPSAVTVVVGSILVSSGGQSYGVSSLTPHPLYVQTPIGVFNDACVIKLRSSIQMNANVKPLPLCESNPRVGADAVVSGWGVYNASNTGVASNQLKYLNVKIVSKILCGISNIAIPLSQNCAQSPANSGVCFGDSGSALVVDGRQVGIVSWGRSCANGRPDVYADVCFLKGWITRNM